MKGFRSKSTFVSILMSIAVALAVSLFWTYGGNAFAEFKALVVPPGTQFTLLKLGVLIVLSVSVGLWAEKISVKKILPTVVCYLALWFCASLIAANFADISLMFIPIALTLAFTLLAMHIKKLWLIDSELTEKLVSLASTGHLLGGRSAELRIESGLRLLETILPFAEAIVFRHEIKGNLIPVGRARNGNKNINALERQSNWREYVELCESALETRQTVIRSIDDEKRSAKIALPLIYEGLVIGVLFVSVDRNFEKDDAALLEAFSGQLAQNFQRRELRQKDLPHQSWSSSFSTLSAENRLDVISLIQGIIKEQSFSALASSYLREAHAIAYLDGTLAYLNRQMRQLADLDVNQISEIDLFRLLDRFRTDVFREPGLAIRRVLQTGESYSGELNFPETGKTLAMQISLVKMPGDNESIHATNVPLKPACFLITFRDISAQKENEKLRSDMASLMSHELRTPITSIKGFAEIMLADENLSEDSREFLTIISNESTRLSKMLTSFLSVSNLEQSDKKEVSKSPVKLDTLVHDVVNEYQETAKRKRIRLVEKPNSLLPPIAADKGLIARAISSLVDNAIRYSPERTSVIISTILESDFLRVVVEDRGYGIHASEHEKIWEKFYRVARDGQDKEEESVGLGLSLVREIVEQHGGNVEVESEVGLGSKFSLKLPRL